MNQPEKEDEFFRARIKNMVSIAENNHYPKFSFFLDGRQKLLAEETLHKLGCTAFCFFGGSIHAQRVMLGVYPDYMQSDELAWPLSILHLAFSKSYTLTHRDFLGSLMALQIKREMIGDIQVSEGEAQIALHEQILDFVQTNLTKVGNVGVKLSVQERFTLETALQFLEIEGTVSSVRLDSVVALVTRLSRTKACELIAAGKVTLNYRQTTAVSEQLKGDDVLSIRGTGKFVLSGEVHTTKKNRLHIKILKFIS